MTIISSRRGVLGSALVCGGVLSAGSMLHATASTLAAELDSDFVHRLARLGGLTGCSVALARNGVPLLSITAGMASLVADRPVGNTTLFHIASITKVVIARALVALAEAGPLDLDTPVGDYVGFAVSNPAFPNLPITTRQLLSHSSSISDQHYYEVDFRTQGADSPLPLAEFVTDYLVPGSRHYAAANFSSEHAPGSQWDYCNVGYALAGLVGERLTGNFRQWIAKVMFKPLEIGDAFWGVEGLPPTRVALPYEDREDGLAALEPVGFPDWPAGGLRMRADQLAQVLSAPMGQFSTLQILEQQVLPGLAPWLTGQGLGWQYSLLGNRALPNHWGGDPGVITTAYLDPDQECAVTVLATGSPSAAARDAIMAIALHMFGQSQ